MVQGGFNFIQPDLQVFYVNDVYNTIENTDYSYYCMLILINGTCSINYKNLVYYLKPGEVHIAHSKEQFFYDFNNQKAEFLLITFNSLLIRKYDENYDLLQPFYDYKHLKILTANDDVYEFDAGIKGVIKALKTRSSRAFVLTPFMQLICELNYLYEKSQPNKIKETDSNYAKIISYIDNHLFEKLTLEQISENVFLSKKCICENIKKFSGVTFLELITERRFIEAKRIIYATNEPLNKIAQRCGFDTYSTFYRGYKKFYKISPKEELERKNKGNKY